MSLKHQLTAKNRDLKVKPQVYRQDGYLLANVFGENQSQALIIPVKEALQLLPQVSESTVIYLSIDEQKEIPVMISEIQKDPITSKVIHLALRQVNLKHKVTAAIPIETTGVFDVPQAVFLLIKDEIEAHALPTDLPEKFVVDVSKLTAIGEQITFADLTYDRQKIQLDFESEDEPIVVVNAVVEEKEEEPTPAPEEDAATPTPSESTDSAPPAEQ